jgi:hypothetical protein
MNGTVSVGTLEQNKIQSMWKRLYLFIYFKNTSEHYVADKAPSNSGGFKNAATNKTVQERLQPSTGKVGSRKRSLLQQSTWGKGSSKQEQNKWSLF